MAKKNSKKTVPELRFRGFTDPWEQRQLGKVAEKVTEKNSGLAYQQVLTNSATHGIVRQSEYFDRIVAGKNHLDAYYVVNPNDYVYNPRISKEAPCGPINRNALELTGIASPLYLVFRVSSQSLAYEFLDQYFKTANWFNYMKLQGNSGARSDRFTIADTDFFSMPVRIPSLPEQRRIGEFFSTLDSLIAAAERQEALLRQKKQAYLQLMFPQEGESEPRLRFAGFSGEWERRQLGEVAEIYRGLTYSPSALSNSRDGVRVLRSSNIDDGIFKIHDDDVFVSRSCINVGYIQRNDILMTAANGSNSLVGKHAIIPAVSVGSMVHGGFMYRLRTEQPTFLNSYFSSPSFNRFLSSRVLGGEGSIGNLSRNDLAAWLLSIPNDSEQRRIGEFFSTIDNLIAVAEQRAKSLRVLKSAYLQRMFV